MNSKIIEISNDISYRAKEADFHPINRHFLQPYFNKIMTLDKIYFLFYNIENKRSLYSTYLMLSLPEIYNNINIDDLINLIKRFTKNSSYYTIIVFAYKYIEINIIGTILTQLFINKEIKKDLVKYIEYQYISFMKDDSDYFFFNNDMFGVSESD